MEMKGHERRGFSLAEYRRRDDAVQAHRTGYSIGVNVPLDRGQGEIPTRCR